MFTLLTLYINLSFSGPIKLHYFNGPALAEPIRFLLHYGSIKFTDERLNSFDEFLTKKETYPYGKVPVLEIEGKTVHQTKAICRYLARKLKLAGKNDWESLECDVMVETIDDFRDALASYSYDKNEESKAQKKGPLFSTTLPFYLNKFETHLTQNHGHFLNGKLTWADFYFAGLTEYFNYMAGQDILEDKPTIKALKDKVQGLTGVKEYVATRALFPPKE